MDDIRKFLCEGMATVSEAMQQINRNAFGIVFLTDEHKKLSGCITDGDIRRFLLAGGTMDSPAKQAANLSPRFARDPDEAKLLYHKKNYIVIPIVDETGVITDLYNGEEGEVVQKKKTPLHVPVVINAGGKGTRLDPYTRVLPKPLIPVGDLPILELIMKEYQSYCCDDFHIIVNYKREIMKAFFVENERKYNIKWYDEIKPLGTGGGLSLLKGKLNETFFFANCDVLLKSNYESMIRFHKENRNAITMICAYKDISIPYGVIEIGKNGSIESMREKPVLSFLTNTGVYIVEPEVLQDIEDDQPIGFPDIVEKEKKMGERVAVFPVSENEWMDMGQLEELEKMRKKLYGD